jgi:hypothetical protein
MRTPQGDIYQSVSETDSPGFIPLAAQPEVSVDLRGLLQL